MLNCLLMISMNGPKLGTEAADEFLTRVVKAYEEKKNYKIPPNQTICGSKSVEVAIQTEEDVALEISLKELEERGNKKYYDNVEGHETEEDESDDEGYDYEDYMWE